MQGNLPGTDQCMRDITTGEAYDIHRVAGPSGNVGCSLTTSDVSAQVGITYGGFTLIRATGRYVQMLTLRNNEGTAVNGPVSLLLSGLSSNAALYQATGSTSVFYAGSPYKDFAQASLPAGASLTVTLEFTKTGTAAISYTGKVVAGLILCPSTTEASAISYTFDTSSLNPAAEVYSLDIQLISSDSSGANSATISNLTVSGGSLLPSQFYASSGGISGTLTSTLVLSSTSFFNSVTQDFTPGSMLSFVLDLTNIAPAGLIPDGFSFAFLLDGFEVATLDPSGNNRLLPFDLTGGSALGGGGQFALPGGAAPMPEPSSFVLIGAGLAAVFAALRNFTTREAFNRS